MRDARDETRVRPAREGDLAGLLRIYNHYVATTHITFDTEPFTEEERRSWFDAFSVDGPYRLFVATLGDRLAGYASSSRFRPKPAYARSVETTIYLDPELVGRGIGRPLYAHLLDSLEGEPAVHRAYAGIALPNQASVALHERLGFQLAGTFREVGFKFGKYWHVSWYEREIAAPSEVGV